MVVIFCYGYKPPMNVSTDKLNTLTARATENIRDVLSIALEYTHPARAVVIYDTENGLTRLLTDAYRIALPDATFIDFATQTKDALIATCAELAPNDLVVLIQSSNFRLDEFRIRLHLFSLGLKVIEHLHLYRNTPESWVTYVNALEYDPSWYRVVGPHLKIKLERAKSLSIESDTTQLVVSGALEEPKLNIGDYRGMETVGGTFPIGEVFTEAQDFTTMNGSVLIYAYADSDFHISMHEPFRVDIKNGLIVGWADNTPQSFIDIVSLVSSYERPLIREIGFGLNRAITRKHYLRDITAFERIYGLHFSLGEKHSVYKKKGITTHKTKFHVDIFPIVTKVHTDTEFIFEHGAYV